MRPDQITKADTVVSRREQIEIKHRCPKCEGLQMARFWTDVRTKTDLEVTVTYSTPIGVGCPECRGKIFQLTGEALSDFGLFPLR